MIMLSERSQGEMSKYIMNLFVWNSRQRKLIPGDKAGKWWPGEAGAGDAGESHKEGVEDATVLILVIVSQMSAYINSQMGASCKKYVYVSYTAVEQFNRKNWCFMERRIGVLLVFYIWCLIERQGSGLYNCRKPLRPGLRDGCLTSESRMLKPNLQLLPGSCFLALPFCRFSMLLLSVLVRCHVTSASSFSGCPQGSRACF